MARELHLNLIEQRVSVWNQWRENNPGIEPDFSGARLFRSHFGKSVVGSDPVGDEGEWVNYLQIRFFKDKLSGANLSKANLSRARLAGLDLSNINLTGAKMKFI